MQQSKWSLLFRSYVCLREVSFARGRHLISLTFSENLSPVLIRANSLVCAVSRSYPSNLSKTQLGYMFRFSSHEVNDHKRRAFVAVWRTVQADGVTCCCLYLSRWWMAPSYSRCLWSSLSSSTRCVTTATVWKPRTSGRPWFKLGRR